MSEKLKVWWSNFKTDPKSTLAGVLTTVGMIVSFLLPAQAEAIKALLGSFSNLVVAFVIFLAGLFSIIGTTKVPTPQK